MRSFRRIMVPVRKVWIKLAKRLRFRKTGVVQLRHEVRTCDYEDVHILWDMLNKNENEIAKSTASSPKSHSWDIVNWAKCAPFLHCGL